MKKDTLTFLIYLKLRSNCDGQVPREKAQSSAGQTNNIQSAVHSDKTGTEETKCGLSTVPS